MKVVFPTDKLTCLKVSYYTVEVWSVDIRNGVLELLHATELFVLDTKWNGFIHTYCKPRY